uniref:Uncharacterized protein n=1 Tax=Arundo donax TaxID=35708 RepID=A0A0A9G413_ARUDO
MKRDKFRKINIPLSKQGKKTISNVHIVYYKVHLP